MWVPNLPDLRGLWAEALVIQLLTRVKPMSLALSGRFLATDRQGSPRPTGSLLLLDICVACPRGAGFPG